MGNQNRAPRRAIKGPTTRAAFHAVQWGRFVSHQAIEPLESRQLLSASPASVADITASPATDSDSTVIATAAKPIKAVAGHSTGPVVVATFTDPGGGGPVSDYSATVIWGDGTPADNNAVIVEKSPNDYSVIDSHTYTQDTSPGHTGGQPYSIRVTIHHGSAINTPSAYTFKTLDSATGSPTSLYGINDTRLASGLVEDPSTFDFSGVVFKNGSGKAITVPGAVDTETYQVNNREQIAVSFFGKSSIYHAAVYDSVLDSWTLLPDVPGARENLAGGINDNGLIVGDTFTNDSFQGGQGWTYQNGHYTFFTAPGSDAAFGGTATYSVNNLGQIVGYVYDSSGVQHGYIKTGSSYSMLNAPGASGTLAVGINNQGIATGGYVINGVPYGFVWKDSVFHTVNFPGASGTVVTSINDNGDLAGLYLDKSGNSHGFEAFNVPATVSNIVITTAAVADLPVVGHPLPNVAKPTLDVSTGAVALAEFTDPGGAEYPDDYSASVNFNDGTAAVAGQITYDSATGYFTVTASHTYKTAGTFAPPTITITHETMQTVVVDLNQVKVGIADLLA